MDEKDLDAARRNLTSDPKGKGRLSSLEQLASLDSMEGIAQAEPTPVPPLLRYVPKGALIHAVYPGLLVAL
ncbi:MAG: hypothetical protein MI923_10710, partial [Phycisphaerales bacterium]|nr:hypothetical protein [Phycisphaerales bacterium]